MIAATPNESTPIRILAADGNTALFPRINIYNAAGAVVSTLSPTHVAEGLYSADWTPTVEGRYTAVGQFFLDALFTTDANYDRVMESIDVNSIELSIARLLGLVHENTVMDQQLYDSNNCLTSARLRTYDSKANAQAAGATGLVASYTITATHVGGLPNFYSMVRDV